MRERASALAVALALAGLACSGGAEKTVISQYFTALKANDTNTLTSFALVQFDKPVDDWRVLAVGPENKAPNPLPDLVKKQKDLEAEANQNTREARAWGNDLAIYPKLDQVRTAEQKGTSVPPALQAIQQKWAAFQAKDRELKKAVAAAKAAVEREKRNATLSVGQMDEIEKLTGEVITKDVDLEITSGGTKAAYVMTMRKYELTGGSGPRMMSRWVIQTLTPKG